MGITLSTMSNLSSSHASSSKFITASAINSRVCPTPAKRKRRNLKIQLLLQGLRARNQAERIARDAEKTMRLLHKWTTEPEVDVSENNYQHLATLILTNKKKKLKAIERKKSALRFKARHT